MPLTEPLLSGFDHFNAEGGGARRIIGEGGYSAEL